MFRKLYGDDPHPLVAICLNNVGDLYEKLGDIQKALLLYKEAFKINRQIYKDYLHVEVVASLWKIGDVCKKLNQKETAKAYYANAFEICKRLPPSSVIQDVQMMLITKWMELKD